MSGSLRTWYSLPDLDRLADRGIGLKGELELKALPRLNDILHADRGSVSADLRFRKRAGWLTVELEYAATLELTCQRCLEGFAYPVSARVEMALVESEAVEGYVPEGCEPLVLEGGRLRPAELVDEAFLRRIRYKVHAEGPSRTDFARIFENCCRDLEIPYDPAHVAHLLDDVYPPRKIVPRGCHPRDLIKHALELARYLEQPRRVTVPLLDAACSSYFVDAKAADDGYGPAVVTR